MPMVVDMADKGIIAEEFKRPATLESESDTALVNGGHLGSVAVDKAESGVVPGPSDSVLPGVSGSWGRRHPPALFNIGHRLHMPADADGPRVKRIGIVLRL